MMRRTLFAALGLALATATPALAACKPDDLQGVWLAKLSKALCTFEVRGNGDLSGVCHGNGRLGGEVQPLEGTLDVGRDCAVSGEILQTVDEEVRTLIVRATLKRAASGSIDGRATPDSRAGKDLTLEATQSW